MKKIQGKKAFTGGKGLKGELFKGFDLLKEVPSTDIKEVLG